MSDETVVVVTPATEEPVETSAEEIAEVVEAVAEVVEEATPDNSGDAVEAVVIETELDLAQRVTALEIASANFATREELDSVRETAWRAEDTAIEATIAAEESTEPEEVEAMIEGTVVTETPEGETVLDAPSDVPPPGSNIHPWFAERKDLLGRVGDWLKK